METVHVSALRALILITSVLVLKTCAGGQCPNTWTVFNNHCYKFIKQRITWFDAQVACKTANSHLVRIESESEHQFVARLARNHGADVWIGLSDLLQEGRFVWDDTQEEPVYTNWFSGQPNNLGGNENCGILWYGEGSLWGDSNCAGQFSAICEKTLSA